MPVGVGLALGLRLCTLRHTRDDLVQGVAPLRLPQRHPRRPWLPAIALQYGDLVVDRARQPEDVRRVLRTGVGDLSRCEPFERRRGLLRIGTAVEDVHPLEISRTGLEDRRWRRQHLFDAHRLDFGANIVEHERAGACEVRLAAVYRRHAVAIDLCRGLAGGAAPVPGPASSDATCRLNRSCRKPRAQSSITRPRPARRRSPDRNVGYGQAVMLGPGGVHFGASEPRHDGAAIPQAPPVFDLKK